MIFAGLAYAAEAFAQDAGGGGGAGGLGGLFNLGNPMILLIAMLAIFYFLLIRPQQKRQKEHKVCWQTFKRAIQFSLPVDSVEG